MRRYLISYDVTGDNDDDTAQPIYNKLDAIAQNLDKNAERKLQSQWLIESNTANAKAICQLILNELDDKERDRIELIITRVTDDSASYPSDLLDRNIVHIRLS